MIEEGHLEPGSCAYHQEESTSRSSEADVADSLNGLKATPTDLSMPLPAADKLKPSGFAAGHLLYSFSRDNEVEFAPENNERHWSKDTQ